VSVDYDKVMTDELDTDSFFPPLAEKRIEWNSQWFLRGIEVVVSPNWWHNN
jgi:hypothetical protein